LCLVSSDGCTFLYRRLGPLDVTLALASDCLDVAHRKILQLLFHRFVGLFFSATGKTAYRDRMGGANCGGRGHRRDTGCNGDETTRACRSGARWSDINDDRDRRAEKALHNLLRRIQQTAWCIELNDQALGILRSGLLNAAGNVTRRRGANRSVDINERNFLRCRSWRSY